MYQQSSHMLIYAVVFSLRHTLACSAWWWTPIKCCPFTQKRSLTCTKGRNDTRSPLISTPSLIMPTGTWCKVGCLHRSQLCDIYLTNIISGGLFLVQFSCYPSGSVVMQPHNWNWSNQISHSHLSFKPLVFLYDLCQIELFAGSLKSSVQVSCGIDSVWVMTGGSI